MKTAPPRAVFKQEVMLEWFDYTDEEVEGGALEFHTGLELDVFQRLEDGEAMAVWLSDDARYFCRVELGKA